MWCTCHAKICDFVLKKITSKESKYLIHLQILHVKSCWNVWHGQGNVWQSRANLPHSCLECLECLAHLHHGPTSANTWALGANKTRKLTENTVSQSSGPFLVSRTGAVGWTKRGQKIICGPLDEEYADCRTKYLLNSVLLSHVQNVTLHPYSALKRT